MVRVCESTDVVMLKDCCCIHVIGNVFDGEFDKSESEMKQLYTECLNLAKSIDAIMLCYNPDIDALKAENLSDMAVRLLDGVSRRDVVKDLEDFRDKWRHYNEQAAAESQVILDKISELFEKDGDSKGDASYEVPYPFDCDKTVEALNRKNSKERALTAAQRLFFWAEYKEHSKDI